MVDQVHCTLGGDRFGVFLTVPSTSTSTNEPAKINQTAVCMLRRKVECDMLIHISSYATKLKWNLTRHIVCQDQTCVGAGELGTQHAEVHHSTLVGLRLRRK